MARRKSKKSPETEAASPREALTRPNPDAYGNASPAASSEAEPSGMVRKSTCIMGMLLTLALGPVAFQAVEGLFWFFTYHLNLTPFLLIIPLFALLGITIPIITGQVSQKHTVVERLRQD